MIEEYLHKKGDSKELIGFSGRHWGYILKSSDKDEYPLIISMGNKITNQTALKIVKKMCKQRIPEPIRLADLITRRLVKARKKFGKNNNIWNWNLKDYLINEHDYLHSNLQQSFEEGKKEESVDLGEEEEVLKKEVDLGEEEEDLEREVDFGEEVEDFSGEIEVEGEIEEEVEDLLEEEMIKKYFY